MTASAHRHDIEGGSLTSLHIGGQRVWVAREVGRLLGYDNDGKRLLTKIQAGVRDGALLAGVDSLTLSGAELAEAKRLLGPPLYGHSPYATAEQLTVLTDTGLNTVAIWAEPPMREAVRRWLADQAAPGHRIPREAHDLACIAEYRRQATTIQRTAERLKREQLIDAAGYGAMQREAMRWLGVEVVLVEPPR